MSVFEVIRVISNTHRLDIPAKLYRRRSAVLQPESAAFGPNDDRSNNGPRIAHASADFVALFEFAARNGEISVFNLLASHAPLCYG